MTVRLLTGDCRSILPTLPDASVQCVVTSPPYWGLRDYGVDGQIGLESGPGTYVTEMVGVFREVWRVLRDDGTLWLNLGDCYATGAGKVGDRPGGGTQGDRWAGYRGTRPGSPKHTDGAIGPMTQPNRMPLPGLKPKDLVGMPWRVAFALQADDWWLRSEITWCKKAPMPESVRDRPTSATEKIFLLTKSPRYFYDPVAVAEPSEMRPQNRNTNGRGEKDAGYAAHRKPPGQAKQGGHGRRYVGFNERWEEAVAADAYPATRNLRNYWLLGPEPFPEAHFAVMPTAVAERCIKAGTSEKGACGACGAPWVRVLSDGEKVQTGNGRGPNATVNPNRHPGEEGAAAFYVLQRETTGWRASCTCNADVVPCVVLDPFSGSGTVSLVSERLGRDSIGIDLSPVYTDMAAKRIRADCPMFAAVETV